MKNPYQSLALARPGWRDMAEHALFILGLLALFYVALIRTSTEQVAQPQIQSELGAPEKYS